MWLRRCSACSARVWGVLVSLGGFWTRRCLFVVLGRASGFFAVIVEVRAFSVRRVLWCGGAGTSFCAIVED